MHKQKIGYIKTSARMLSLHLVLLFLLFATTPSIFQHSRIHIQCLWENDDISLTVDHKIHSVDEKLATEKNVSGYACKGNEPNRVNKSNRKIEYINC